MHRGDLRAEKEAEGLLISLQTARDGQGGLVGGRAAGTGYETVLFCSVWKKVGGNDSLERIRMRENGFRGGSLFSPVLTVPSSG